MCENKDTGKHTTTSGSHALFELSFLISDLLVTEPWRRTVGLKQLNIGWEPEQSFGRKLLWNKDAIISN